MGELLVGIDLGGTNMTVGVLDGSGSLLGRVKRKTKASQGVDGVVERIVEAIRRACDDAKVSIADVAAVGIGAPGPIDIHRGTVIKSGNLGWQDVPLRSLLSDAVGRPVTLDNDVNVAAYGEATLGAARGRQHLLAAWVGTGVGGALMFHGSLFPGSFFTAGEIGYTVVIPEGGPGASTLEEHCSRTAMTAAIRRLLPSFPDSVLHRLLKERDIEDARELIGSSVIAEAVGVGDELATRVVHHAADVLGLALANWITMLSIDTVVLGGGVTEALGEPFIARIRASFDRWVFPPQCRACSILASGLGDLAGVYGAAMLAQRAMQGGAR